MIPPSVYLAIGIALASAFGGWHAHTIYDKSEERDQLAGTIIAMQLDQQEAKQISQGVQAALSSLQIVNKTINNEVRHEITEKPVYRDVNCALPDSGRVQLDAAIAAANRALRLDAGMPGSTKASGQPVGRPAGVGG